MENVGWFSSFEMAKTTALAVQKEKDKKYITMLDELPNGKCIVKWRGMTKEEQAERKRQQKVAKNIVG